MRILFSFLLLFYLLSQPCFAGIRIAVVSFEDKTGKAGYDLVRSLIDSTTDELYKTGKFTLLERDRIGTILQEQKLSMTGLIDSNTAADIGKVIGADYVLIGTILNYGESVQENTLNGADLSGGKFGIGGLSVNKLNLFVDLTIRIIEVDTGKILFSSSGSDSYRKTAYGLTVVQDGEQIHLGRNLSDSTMGLKIARKALSKAVENLLFFPLKIKGADSRVIKLEGDSLLVARGQSHGLTLDDQFRVFGRPVLLTDPVNGESLGYRRKELFNRPFRFNQIEKNYSVCILNDAFFIEKLKRELASLDLTKGEFLEVRMSLTPQEEHYNAIIDAFEKGLFKKTVHLIKLYSKNYRRSDYLLEYLMASSFDRGQEYHAAYSYYEKVLALLPGYFLPGITKRMQEIRTYLRNRK